MYNVHRRRRATPIIRAICPLPSPRGIANSRFGGLIHARACTRALRGPFQLFHDPNLHNGTRSRSRVSLFIDAGRRARALGIRCFSTISCRQACFPSFPAFPVRVNGRKSYTRVHHDAINRKHRFAGGRNEPPLRAVIRAAGYAF